MATIVTRAGKGSPLTNNEVDANFENLNAEVTPLRHSIRPSLLLDFANSKQLDPRITFSRASTGTYYDGKTFAKAEENLLSYSQEFDNGYWIKYKATVTANSTTAPDGTSTAEELFEDNTSGLHYVYNDFGSNFPTATQTFSIYVKANGRDFATICSGTIGTSDYYAATVDLTNGTITQETKEPSGRDGSVSVVDSGNGWYRVSMSTTGERFYVVGLATQGTFSPGSYGYESYIGDVTKSIYIWGAQVEQRSSVTAYTPTTTQPITNYIPVLQTAAAGTARFDHDPVTGESKGLLIEEQRTNYITNSAPIHPNVTSGWGDDGTGVYTPCVAPDGSLEGINVLSKSPDLIIRRDFGGLTGNTTYTFSVWVRSRTTSTIRILIADGYAWNNQEVEFLSITNEWKKYSVTRTNGSGITSVRVAIGGSGNLSTNKEVEVWGAQLEAGAFPTSYIKTTSAQATRNADAASMTGTNFSDWYRQDEGSLYTEFSTADVGSSSASRTAFIITDGTNNNRFFMDFFNNTIRLVAAGNTSSASVLIQSPSQGQQNNTFYKMSGCYALNDYAFTYEGTLIGTDTDSTLPISNQALIGNYLSTKYINGTIKKLAYYPTRLTNAELQALTEE